MSLGGKIMCNEGNGKISFILFCFGAQRLGRAQADPLRPVLRASAAPQQQTHQTSSKQYTVL